MQRGVLGMLVKNGHWNIQECETALETLEELLIGNWNGPTSKIRIVPTCLRSSLTSCIRQQETRGSCFCKIVVDSDEQLQERLLM